MLFEMLLDQKYVFVGYQIMKKVSVIDVGFKKKTWTGLILFI